MAGDWIKVEHATLEKPEVTRSAEMLGISRREAVGLFFEYFVWLDKNLSADCPDFVRNVSRRSLENVLHCAGFAACLEAIGWARFDDDTWTLHVINAERHNGNTAKTRALDAKRKAKTRAEVSASSPENVRPREEKSSKEKKSALAEPNDQHRTLAESLGVNCETEFQKYRDWMASTGKHHKDEVAGFRNWLRNAKANQPKKHLREVATDWWRTEEGVAARARELGVSARPGESMDQFIARLHHAARAA